MEPSLIFSPAAATAIFAVLAVLTWFNTTSFGWLLFAGAMALMDRHFAYVHITLGYFPFYITEFFLLLLFVRYFLFKPSSFLKVWYPIPKQARIFYLFFMGISLIQFIRGLYSFPALNVLRDTALFYYSLFIFPILIHPIPASRYRIFGGIFGVIVIFKCIVMSLHWQDIAFPHISIFLAQPAASSLIFALLLIALLTATHLRLGVLNSLIGIAIVATILIERVRSSWISLFVAVPVLLILFAISEKGIRWIWDALKTILILSLGCWVFFNAMQIKTFYHHTDVYAVKAPRVPVNKTLSVPRNSVGVKMPKQEVVGSFDKTPNVSHVLTTKKSMETPANSQDSRVESQELSPASAVESEFKSLFLGKNSPNVMTRLWMWKDALSELFMTGIYSPSLGKSDLNQYHLPKDALYDDRIILNVIGGGNQPSIITLPIVKPGQTTMPAKMVWRMRCTHILFGFPFGKHYLPPEVVWCVESVDRYDPHNSLIALFYRTGLIGFISFTGFIGSIWLYGCRTLRHTTYLSNDWALLAASLAGICCCLVHALSDNVFENSFKGMWLWVLAGIILSTCHQIKKHSTTSASE